MEADVNSHGLRVKEGILLERIWPPCNAPDGWLSQIGGSPRLPPELEWPHTIMPDGKIVALDFLAQIHMADLPDIKDRELLPKNGILYFFAISLAGMPLEPTQWRVLFSPSDGSDCTIVEAPASAGHGLNDGDCASVKAEDLHDPDDPPSMLYPRCPVRPMPAPFWERPCQWEQEKVWRELTRQWQGSKLPESDFKYDPNQLPYRVEDALLLLNRVRNQWVEGSMSTRDFIYSHFSYELERTERSNEIVSDMLASYGDWLGLVNSEVLELKKLRRSLLLDTSTRERVLDLIHQHDAIVRIVHKKHFGFLYGNSIMESTAQTSLATILLEQTALADVPEQEIAAAHPGKWGPEFESHRMLGYPRVVQSSPDEEEVLLLQLDSDYVGPRFQWWDMGNITFWIGRKDLELLNFDAAVAEIEGH